MHFSHNVALIANLVAIATPIVGLVLYLMNRPKKGQVGRGSGGFPVWPSERRPALVTPLRRHISAKRPPEI